MTDSLRENHDDEEISNDDPLKNGTYYPKKARDPLVLMLGMLLFALLAIAGIVVAVTENHKDPNAITLPVHVAKSLDQDQPLSSVETANDDVMPEEEMTGDMILDRDELPASKIEELEQHEAPMNLNPITPVPEFSPQGVRLHRPMTVVQDVQMTAIQQKKTLNI